MAHDNDRDDDWIERLVSIAGTLGFNKVQVRWKLRNRVEKFREKKQLAGQHVRHAGYEHKICGQCGALQDKGVKRCQQCGAPLAGVKFQMLSRLGFRLPSFVSASSVIGLLILIAYARVALSGDEGTNFFSIGVKTLFRFGGHLPDYVRASGEYWRFGTAMFLHAGIMHLGFNLFALSQVGPALEGIYGRSRFIVIYVVTGLLASLTSFFFIDGVGIGASGALMGVIGLGAGWGHRQGTVQGKAIRNMMVQWFAYTIIFGFMIHADNAAHAGGFASGALIGYYLPAPNRARPDSHPGWIVGSLVAWAAIIFFVVKILWPAYTADFMGL